MADSISHKSKVVLLYGGFGVLFLSGLILMGFDPMALFTGRRVESLPTVQNGVAAVRPKTIETIASPEELALAEGHDKLIIHFDVEWSMQAVASRPVIAGFREEIEKDRRYQDVVFRRVDCTEQHGVVWDAVGRWLSEQRADPSLMGGGYGSVAWVRFGKVVGVVHHPTGAGVEDLMAKTRQVMPISTQAHR